MNNNDMRKLDAVLKGIQNGSISNQDIQNMLRSPQGQKLVGQLGPMEKQKLMSEFSKLDTNTIKRKLSKVNTRELSGLSADELVKRLKNL